MRMSLRHLSDDVRCLLLIVVLPEAGMSELEERDGVPLLFSLFCLFLALPLAIAVALPMGPEAATVFTYANRLFAISPEQYRLWYAVGSSFGLVGSLFLAALLQQLVVKMQGVDLGYVYSLATFFYSSLPMVVFYGIAELAEFAALRPELAFLSHAASGCRLLSYLGVIWGIYLWYAMLKRMTGLPGRRLVAAGGVLVLLPLLLITMCALGLVMSYQRIQPTAHPGDYLEDVLRAGGAAK